MQAPEVERQAKSPWISNETWKLIDARASKSKSRSFQPGEQKRLSRCIKRALKLLVEPTIIKLTAASVTILTRQNGTPSISCTFFVSSSSEVFVFFSAGYPSSREKTYGLSLGALPEVGYTHTHTHTHRN
jgi:hypothetical protein